MYTRGNDRMFHKSGVNFSLEN